MNFNEALKLFQRSKDMLVQDTPSALYIDRCEELVYNPPGDDWDGVFTAKTK
jgi:adenylate cyclase